MRSQISLPARSGPQEMPSEQSAYALGQPDEANASADPAFAAVPPPGWVVATVDRATAHQLGALRDAEGRCGTRASLGRGNERFPVPRTTDLASRFNADRPRARPCLAIRYRAWEAPP